MYIYAGIDEAGYGPLLGPLLVGRYVLALPDLPCDAKAPDLWKPLSKAVCKTLTGRKGRIAVNDSKKVHTPASGVAHLERGVLAFASLIQSHQSHDSQQDQTQVVSQPHALHVPQPATLDAWLACLGEERHLTNDLPRWYQAAADHPWAKLPFKLDAGELAVCRGMLKTEADKANVQVLDYAAAVVFEDQFNEMVSATRSKAATSFTFVAKHLRFIFDSYGQHLPHVAVDRQSGRSHYRELLAQSFPEAVVSVLGENATTSAYRVEDKQHDKAMNVAFMVGAEERHMPVALASMISKYTRELLMARFNAYFCRHWPHIKPTAGYATDGRRFINEVQHLLPEINLHPRDLCRLA